MANCPQKRLTLSKQVRNLYFLTIYVVVDRLLEENHALKQKQTKSPVPISANPTTSRTTELNMIAKDKLSETHLTQNILANMLLKQN